MEVILQIVLTAVITCIIQSVFLDIRERRKRRSSVRDRRRMRK